MLDLLFVGLTIVAFTVLWLLVKGVERRGFYKLIGIDRSADQKWSVYLRSILAFSFVAVIFLYFLQRLQHFLPFSEGFYGVVRADHRSVRPGREQRQGHRARRGRGRLRDQALWHGRAPGQDARRGAPGRSRR